MANSVWPPADGDHERARPVCRALVDPECEHIDRSELSSGRTTPRLALVDLSTQQHVRRLDRTVARGEMKPRKAALKVCVQRDLIGDPSKTISFRSHDPRTDIRALVDVRSGIKERADHVRVVPGDRPHERRLPLHSFSLALTFAP